MSNNSWYPADGLWTNLDGAIFTRSRTYRQANGLDRVQKVLNLVNRSARTGQVSQKYDPISYGLALAIQTGRLGRLPMLYLSQMNARQVVNFLVKIDLLGLTPNQIPSWMNQMDLSEGPDGTVSW